MDQTTHCLGLLRRRQVYFPTWRGLVVLALAAALVTIALVRGVPVFLACNRPVPARMLVVEGWAPDFAFDFVAAELRRAPYDKVIVTGGPVEFGAPLAEYRTYAERGAAILLAMGLSSNLVEAVAAPRVMQDRTYTSAVAVRRWMQVHALPDQPLNLVTVGPHARRSRLLYQKAFGHKVAVGTFSVPSPEFDPRRWYASSAGFRTMIGESLAYGYARLFFHPRDPSLALPAK
jgi:hypothetical protein